MAEFLTTVGNSFYIEKLILNAEKNLTLVTPYLKLSKTLIERINDACRRDIKITLIYGKNELGRKEREVLSKLDNVQIYFCENLHAKCYYNEDALIITSMNLYEFSERNNREMGILVDRVKDEDLYINTIKEVDSIINSSSLEKDFNEKDRSLLNLISKKEILVLDNEKYNERHNFHYPSIKKYLELICKGHQVQIDNTGVCVLDFPREKMTLEVSGRIDIHFTESSEYNLFKKHNKSVIGNGLETIRFYWNKNQINIYTERKFNPEHNEKGLEVKVMKYIQIIQKAFVNTKLVKDEIFPLISD